MKPRKIIITIEAKSNIPLGEFTRLSLQYTFNQYFTDKYLGETLIIHQVKKQVVKEDR